MPSGNLISTDLIKCYLELSYHRCYLVEGVRIVALRNLSHLSRVRHELRIAEFDDHESVVAAQNKMLDDQGGEKTDTNRWFLDFATWMPWEIYICLLYAELEYYNKISQLHQPLVYRPLEEYMSAHEQFVDSLRLLRHSILHPMQDGYFKERLERFFDGTRQAGQDPHGELMIAQHHIDDYLKWLRSAFLESFTGVTSALSIRRPSDPCCHPFHILASLQGNSLDKKNELSLRKSELTALALPVPENNTFDPAAIQTPIHPGLATLVPCSKTEGQSALRGLKLPNRLQRKRSGVPELLLRSLILLNEPFTIMMREDWSADKWRVESAMYQQQTAIETAPFFVSLALLSEPLHLYKKDSAKNKGLEEAHLQKRIKRNALRTFSSFRNAVFHVSEDGSDALEVMASFYDEVEKIRDYREIFGGLLTFYLSDPERP